MLVFPWLVATFSILFAAFGAWTACRFARTNRDDSALWCELPPLSILKPLKGLEEALESNLRSFFAQDYPRFELIFSSDDEADPAMKMARELAREYPAVQTRFVRAEPSTSNPKVANVEAALHKAEHDLVFQSDANVWAQPDLLRNLVREYARRDAALLSSVVVGVGEQNFFSSVENLQLTTHVLPCVCFALSYFNTPCVIGKSMMFRRSDVERLGALARVRDVLAEDYVLGEMFHAAGLPVCLSATPCFNVNQRADLARFVRRHSRWLQMRAVIDKRAFFADILAYSTAWAFLGWSFAMAVGGRELVLYASASLTVILMVRAWLDQIVLRQFRESGMPWWVRLTAPLVRELLLFFVCWPIGLVSRRVRWRGTDMCLYSGSKMIRVERGVAIPRTL